MLPKDGIVGLLNVISFIELAFNIYPLVPLSPVVELVIYILGVLELLCLKFLKYYFKKKNFLKSVIFPLEYIKSRLVLKYTISSGILFRFKSM